MSTQILDKLERMAEIAERIEGLIDKIPRLAEMFGVALFAGRASEKLGGRFEDGFIGGIVADGLAHSRLPNNQVGGLALGTYFASLGLLTFIPDTSPWGGTYTPEEIERMVHGLTKEQCAEQGGTWIEGLHGIGEACLLPER